MAPNSKALEIIEISDDESLPSTSANGQRTSSNANARSTIPHRCSGKHGFRQIVDGFLGVESPTMSSPKSSRDSPHAASQKARRVPTSPRQKTPTKSDQSSKAPKNANISSSKQKSNAIVLSDSEEDSSRRPSMRKTFVRPRGLSPPKTAPLPAKSNDSGPLLAETSPGKRKRPTEGRISMDSQSPSKRLKANSDDTGKALPSDSQGSFSRFHEINSISPPRIRRQQTPREVGLSASVSSPASKRSHLHNSAIARESGQSQAEPPASEIGLTDRRKPHSPQLGISDAPSRESLIIERLTHGAARSRSQLRGQNGVKSGTDGLDTPSTKNGPTKGSSEEDQGYASLSSNNGEDRQDNTDQQKSTSLPNRPGAGVATQLDSSTTADDFPSRDEDGEMNPESPDDLTKIHQMNEAEAADFQLRSEALQNDPTTSIALQRNEDLHSKSLTTDMAAQAISRLPLANRVERILGSYLEELRGDNEYWTSTSLRRARLTRDAEHEQSLPSSETRKEEPTSFANIQPLPMTLYKKASLSTKLSQPEEWSIQKINQDGRPAPSMAVTIPSVPFSTENQDVPDYAHYVSITNNLLAPNVIHLHCWPYFGDDFDMDKAGNLHDQYNIDIVDRERKLLLLLQAQKYEQYVESTLEDLECSWADVLRFLLEPHPDVGSELDAQEAYKHRDQFCQEDFKRNSVDWSARWGAILESLPPSTPERIGRAAVLCEIFQKMAKFSLWHVARRSQYAASSKIEDSEASAEPADNKLTCRICLRFNCPYHGQIRHFVDDSDSEGESAFSVDTAVATDIINPLKVNYKTRVGMAPASSSDPYLQIIDGNLRRKQKDPNYWSGYIHEADKRGPFYPCFHPGTTCEHANCSCFAKSIPCEKACGCPANCVRKFKGCSCGPRRGDQTVCFENAGCVCWQLGRECDPDLCGSCGVCDVVDPVNKYVEQSGRCRNGSIQRGLYKHTLLGDSGVHGLGLFACEHIKENEFVGEYKGEIITKQEAERRGAVYEHQKLSYLFSLNKAQEIDSTYFGNKMRFINHAGVGKANLYPRIIMVNTVHRIALYAGRDIPAGKELLFNYGPKFPDEQLQEEKKSKKSAPHVRNANLVKGFYDVSESEDEDGNFRAKAVSRARGARKKSKAKPQVKVARTAGAARPPLASSSGSAQATQTQKGVKTKQEEDDEEQNAGQRLVAFNISDELQPDVDGGVDSDDDEPFEPEASESVESDEDEDSESEEAEEEVDSPRRTGRVRRRSRR